MRRLAALALVCGCGRVGFDPRSNATGGDGAGSSATLLFQDGFEAPTLDPRWSVDCQATSAFDGPLNGESHTGSSSVRMWYGAGTTSSTYCSIQPLLDMLGRPAGMTDLYIRAWVLIQGPIDPYTKDIGRPLVYLRKDIAGGVGVLDWTFSAYGTGSGTSNALSGQLDALELDGSTVHQECFYYDVQDPACSGSAPQGTVTQNVIGATYSTWHCIDLWAHCNTASGSHDGQWMGWIDGQLKIAWNGYDACGPWPGAGRGGYDHLHIGDGADQVGSNINELRFWDDYELWDTTGVDYRAVPSAAGCR